MPRKPITKKDLKGLKFDDEINWLLDDINRKGDINGRYFSAWWFDRYRPDKAENKAMAAIIWQLLVNNLDTFGFTFNEGAEAQLDLQQAAEFIGEKLNTWSGIIVKEFRSMAYLGYGIDVCDACGLNSLYLKLNKTV